MLTKPSSTGLHHTGPREIEQIGRYRLGAAIAVGGMGIIHRGLLTGAADFSRVVAIKRLRPELTREPLFKTRFIEEARLMARVLHTNVVQLLDVVESAGELWLIMEYVDGETLQALAADARAGGRPLPLAVIVAVLTGVLDGLHAAHDARDAQGRLLGIMHRDVSPQNIMINSVGQAKVIDFGIARATAHAGDQRAPSLGKVSYLSPEQARGSVGDRRSDTFAASVVLWETLTGTRLFREPKQTQAGILNSVMNKPVAPPSAFRDGIPPALDRVVLRALERDPEKRFATAHEFARALAAAFQPASAAEVSAYLTAPRGLDNEVTVVSSTDRAQLPRQASAFDKRRGAKARTLTSLAACASLWLVHSQPSAQRVVALAPESKVAEAPPLPANSRASVAPHAAAHDVASSEVWSPASSRSPTLPTADPVTPSAPRKHRNKQAAAGPRRTSPVAADCANPTYLGADGIRRVKEKCL